MKNTDVIHTTDNLRKNRIAMMRMESFAPVDFVKNAVLSFKESMTAMKNYLVYLQGYKGEDKTIRTMSAHISAAGDLHGFNFVSNARMLVQCPTGFNGKMGDYVAMLNKEFPLVLQKTVEEISDMNIYLAQFISNKSSKISTRDNVSRIRELNRWRAAKAETLTQFFGKGDNQRLPLEKMFVNNPDILNSAAIALGTYRHIYETDPRNVVKSVEELVSRIDVIIDLAENAEDVEISKEAIQNIAELSYEVGRIVELFANFCSSGETAAVVMDNALERIIPLSK